MEAIQPRLLPNFNQLIINNVCFGSTLDFAPFHSHLLLLQIYDMLVVSPTAPFSESTPFDEALLTLSLSPSYDSKHCFGTSFVSSLLRFKGLGYLRLRRIDSDPEFGVDGTLAGILGRENPFPQMQLLSLGVSLWATTPDSFYTRLLEWISQGREIEWWPGLVELEWAFVFHIKGLSDRTFSWMVKTKTALEDAGYAVSFSDDKQTITGTKKFANSVCLYSLFMFCCSAVKINRALMSHPAPRANG